MRMALHPRDDVNGQYVKKGQFPVKVASVITSVIIL